MHGVTPLGALLRGQLDDLGALGFEDALLVTLVEGVGLLVHLHGDLGHDLAQLAAYIFRQAVPELGVGDHHVVEQAVVGLGDVLLHLVHLLAVDVRVGVLGTVDHAGLQALVNLGEAHLARVGAHRLELLLQHGGGLYTELQAAGVLGLAQRLVGRQLLEAVVPVTQAGDALGLHGGKQLLAFGALLEAIHRGHVVEQEGQVEYLQLLGVMLELGQGRGNDLYVAKQQGLHFLAVAKQRGVRVDLYAHFVTQALFGQLFEQQGALALGGVLGDYMGELDHDRLGGLGQAGDTERQGADQRLGSELEH